MVSKEVLSQYSDLQEEIKEIREKIGKLENNIARLQKTIDRIEAGEVVKDKVRGGLGGQQNFNIEGIPFLEYEKTRSNLLMQKLLLNQRKSTLEILEFGLLEKTNEVEEFIAAIQDSRMRRIVNLRVLENFSWNKVADRIGGGNTEGSVKMAFQRFIER